MNEVSFSAACARALLRKPGGIGMLGEKALHSAMKYYYEPDETCHEREFMGFVADVLNGEGVIEVQTRNLFAMKRKLAVFLRETSVTLVHPIVRERRIIYMDPETGELSRPRRSPKRGRTEDAYLGLVHVREALSERNLVVVIPLVDAEEYRVRGAGAEKRRGGRADLKYELLPTELVSETVLVTPEDHLRLLPDALREGGELKPFTVKELAHAGSLPVRTASAMCAAMTAAGALTRRRQGRSYVYERAEGEER